MTYPVLPSNDQSDAVLQNPPAGRNQTITAPDIAEVPLTIDGLAGQTANLQEWRDDTGFVRAAISSAGTYRANAPAGASDTYALLVLQDDAGDDVLRMRNDGALQLSDGADLNPGATDEGMTIFRGSHIYGSVPGRSQYTLGNTNTALDYGGILSIKILQTSAVGIQLDAAPGQTANLQEWRDGAGLVLSSIDSTGAFNPPSDAALKQAFSPIPNALDIIDRLEGEWYDWKANGKRDGGIVAQKAHAAHQRLGVLPTEGAVGSTNYHAVIAVLVEAVKELKAIVDQK